MDKIFASSFDPSKHMAAFTKIEKRIRQQFFAYISKPLGLAKIWQGISDLYDELYLWLHFRVIVWIERFCFGFFFCAIFYVIILKIKHDHF